MVIIFPFQNVDHPSEIQSNGARCHGSKRHEHVSMQMGSQRDSRVSHKLIQHCVKKLVSSHLSLIYIMQSCVITFDRMDEFDIRDQRDRLQ